MTELSPARQALLKSVVDTQERMLDGCSRIFEGLMEFPDPQVSGISKAAIEAIQTNRDILDAMIDGLNSTFH